MIKYLFPLSSRAKYEKITLNAVGRPRAGAQVSESEAPGSLRHRRERHVHTRHILLPPAT
jgi:hypothetical protein